MGYRGFKSGAKVVSGRNLIHLKCAHDSISHTLISVEDWNYANKYEIQ